MTVALSIELFAKLAGRHLDHKTALFEVSESFMDNHATGEWSGPVRFRLVRREEGAIVEMEMQSLHGTFTEPAP